MSADKRAMRLLHERVARGAALLDRKVPGWDETIEVRSLDLGSPWRCVIGQAAERIIETITGTAVDLDYTDNPFDLGTDALGLHEHRSYVSYGFEATLARRHDYGYHELTEAWCDLLSQRRLDRQLIDSLALREHLSEMAL